MSWFCGGKSNKKKKDNSKRGGTTPRDSIESFAVIRQALTPQAADELAVQQGQVVEILYTNKDWIYVKNVDGERGYVPKDFCFPLERLEQIQSVRTAGTTISRPKPRPRTLRLQDRRGTPPGGSDPRGTGGGDVVAAAARAQSVLATSAQRSRNVSRVIDTSRCVGRLRECEEAGSEGSSSSPNTVTIRIPGCGEDPSVQPRDGRVEKPGNGMLHRAMSYRQAVISTDQRWYGLLAVTRPQVVSPLGDRNPEHNYETLDSAMPTPYTFLDDPGSGGDVFKFDEKKPLGIFMSTGTYNAQFQGEVTLKRGEMVVVMDYGRGDWAWVLTAMKQEGLVPKSFLTKYAGEPMTKMRASESEGVAASTQTELLVSSAIVRGSTPGPRGLSIVRGSTPEGLSIVRGSTPGGLSIVRGSTPEGLSIVRGSTPGGLSNLGQAHHNSMSMRRYSAVEAMGTAPTPRNVPHTFTCREPSIPEWFRSNEDLCQGCEKKEERGSPAQRDGPLLSASQLPTHQEETCSASTLERRADGHQMLSKLDFEPEYDTISYISEQRKVRQTPVLIVLKDCNPPPTTKHTLVLKKGDILHHRPQNHYLNGWMWVYHTSQKVYGYVPRTHVAYMYVVQKKPRSGCVQEEPV